MNRLSLAAALALLLSGVASAQGALPEAKLKELKDATAFIKVITPDITASGSGFLFKKEGNFGFLATNAHVVATTGNRKVTAVFFPGTKDELTLKATVVCEDEARDLAVLKVESEKLPPALNLSTKAKIRETLPIYIFGFPFGEALSTSRGSPSVTIGKGSVSSLRMGDDGELALVQLDGDINPGNSGGPVVDVSGALVGIAVAEVRNTNIGLAIPARELDLLLAGRIQGVTFNLASNGAGVATYDVTVRLMDPLGKLKSVSVMTVVKSKVKQEPARGATGWGLASPEMLETRLKIEGASATGQMTFKGETGTTVEYYQQPKFAAADMKPVYFEPAIIQVRFEGSEKRDPAVGGSDTGGKKKDDDDWLGSDDSRKKADAAAAGKSVETGEALAGTRTQVVDAFVTEVKIATGGLHPCVTWSKDATSFFTLDNGGLVRKITWPDLKEERQILLGAECSWMGMSSEGPVVMVCGLQELWVLDTTLAVTRKVAVANSRSFATSPVLAMAFVQQDRSTLLAVDLKSGKTVKTYNARDLESQYLKKIRKHKQSVNLGDFNHPTLTPDGRYLFCVGSECLQRFKVDGSTLVYEEMGPRLGNNPQQIDISGDSKYVAMLSGGGNSQIGDHPEIGTYGTYVYRVSDLQMPIMTIKSGAYPRTLAFDKAAGKIYTANHDHALIVFDPKGVKEKEYGPSGVTDPTQILIHPDGFRALVLSGAGQLIVIELPKP